MKQSSRSLYYGEAEERENLNSFYINTFKWMFIGLMISGVTAFLTAMLGTLGYVSNPFMFVICLVEVILVIVFSSRFDRVSSSVALTMYFLITFINGITLSSIFYVYELGSMAICFILAACMFGAMAIYGRTTKRDLAKWQPMLLIALITCLIALIINLIIGNTLFDMLISVAVIVVMMLVTAFDIYTMKDEKIRAYDNAHIFFALSLFLDFLNIFLYLLRLFGINTSKNK